MSGDALASFNKSASNPYTGPYNFGNKGYYIHLHEQNIGRAMNGKSENLNAPIFEQHRKSYSVSMSKSHFKDLLRQSVSSTNPNAIARLFDSDDTVTSLLNNLKADFEQIDLSDIKKVQNIHTNIKNPLNIKKLEEMNDFLTKLDEASKIVSGSKNNAMSIAIMQVIKGMKDSNKISTVWKSLSAKLEAQINKIDMGNKNGISADEKAILNAMRYLKTLSDNINKDKITKIVDGKEKTISKSKSILTSLDQNIFSTAFIEYLYQKVFTNAVNVAGDVIGSGTNAYKQESFTGGKANYSKLADSAAGKTDMQLSNMSASIENNGNIYNYNCNVGFSIKGYKGAELRIKNGEEVTYDIGAGMNMSDALRATFATNERLKYLAYNVLACGSYNEDNSFAALRSLQADLLTRNLITLAFSRGRGDFSTFIYLNGYLFSAWDILNYVYMAGYNEIGGRSSSGNGINLSIEGRYKNIESIKDRYDRVKDLNDAINGMKITARIHIQKLMSTLAKQK